MTPNKRPIGTLSIDVKLVYERLAKCSTGDLVTYEDLSAIIGRDIRLKANWVLGSARRRAFTQNQMLFGAIAKVGVKRLSDAEIVATGQDALTRIHKTSLRAARRMTAIRSFDTLDAPARTKHDTYLSALGVLSHLTKEKSMQRLEEKVKASGKTLALARTLEAFSEK